MGAGGCQGCPREQNLPRGHGLSSREPRTWAPQPGSALVCTSQLYLGHMALYLLASVWGGAACRSGLARSLAALGASPVVCGFAQHRPGKVISLSPAASANDDAWRRPVTLQSALPGLSAQPAAPPRSPSCLPGQRPATAPEDQGLSPTLGGWCQGRRGHGSLGRPERRADGRATGALSGPLRGVASKVPPAGNWHLEPFLEEPWH